MERIAGPVASGRVDRREGSARAGETAMERIAGPVATGRVDREGSARAGETAMDG